LAKARLDSWKAIAEYLKRSPRTVQRWHADFGLPVHHFGGGKGPVFSYTDELDAWLTGFSETAGDEHSEADPLKARERLSRELAAQAAELWEVRTEENLSAIAALYRSAIAQDPTNGAAFAGMANAIILSALTGILRGSAAYPRAAEAVQRAIRLGCEGPETQCAVAWLQLLQERKWKRALTGFDQVLAKEPRSSHALTGRALVLVAAGDLDEAAHALRAAWSGNTFAGPSTALLGWVQFLAGNYEEALQTVAEARSSGEGNSLTAAVEALARVQSAPPASRLRTAEAAAANQQSPVLLGVLGYAYAASDQTGHAREVLNQLSRTAGDSSYPIALVLTGLGERHQALTSLESSYAGGSLWSIGFRDDPFLRSIREDPGVAPRLLKLVPSI
jgi:tetratricopeptide (TPR) repeat protein